MWTLSEENEAKIPEWNKRWIEDVILRTKPMTPQDKLEVETAIRAMYRLGNLDGDNLNVVFVRSPFAAQFATVCALAFCRKNNTNNTNDTRNVIFDYAYEAAHVDLSQVTYDAAVHATRESIHNAIDDALYLFTINATKSAFAIVPYAMYDPAYVLNLITKPTIDGVISLIGNKIVKECMETVHLLKNDGNLYSFDCSSISFVRDIIGFECEEHKNYKHYETCTKQSSVRYMHSKFCIISDFPTELHNYIRNGRLVAHNDKGPSHLWSDGYAIWTIDGVKVNEQIVMNPETLTIEQIDEKINEEVKRIMIERFTWTRYITETNAKCLDARINDVDGTSEALMMLKDKSVRLLCACKSTARVYAIGVDETINNCQEAQSWMAGDKKINVIGVS